MQAIKIENNDEARDRETHVTYFMVPLPHTFEVALERLGYVYGGESTGPNEKAMQDKIGEAIAKTCTHILAHQDGYRSALLPGTVVENLLWEDLIGFMRCDSHGYSPFEETPHCKFYSRSPETEMYSQFNDWTLWLHVYQHQAVLHSLGLAEDGDEYVLYDVNSISRPSETKIEFRSSIEGDWERLLARIETLVDEWSRLEQPPRQQARWMHIEPLCEGFPVKRIREAERETSSGKLPGPGRPGK